MPSRLVFVFFFATLLGWTSLAFAQDEAPLIEEIRIEFEGPRNVSEDAVRFRIQLQEGQPYDQALADRSIRALYGTGYYDSIQVSLEPAPDNRLIVIFSVLTKYRISAIFFEGNDEISTRRLRREIELEVGTSLNERRINEAREAMLTYYQEKRFTNAVIEYDITRSEESGQGTVTFLISEGNRIRLADIRFIGNDNVGTGRLRRLMEVKRWSIISWLTGSGKFKETEFGEDVERLKAYYREQGYLDVEIPDAGIRFLYPDDDRLDIVIEIREGREYQVGEVSFQGVTLFPPAAIRSTLELQTGDVFAPSKLDEDVQTIQDIYGSRGYLETRVRPERIANLETGRIDINYRVNESDRFRVESISIEGNTKTKSVVLLRELALAPGQIFDTVRMDASKARLENTRFFDEVNVQPESTNLPGRKNLKVAVREARTGNVTFGAGFSSLEEGVIFVELTQSNFDLFNWRSFFQGDGQKLRVLAQLGSNSSEFVLSFEEPWLFEQRLAFGFQLFRTETDFVSSIYNELRTGFEVYFRRRLFELVTGRLAYRLETVDIFDVSPNASSFILSEQGERVVSKLTLTMVRDTRNRLVFTSAGNRVSLTTSLAGTALGGDTDYLLLEFRGAQFIPTFRWPVDQHISLIGRVGTIIDLDDEFETVESEVSILVQNEDGEFVDEDEDGQLDRTNTVERPNIPLFDRFFLGGPESLRGFDYREVGPRDPFGEAIGGRSFAFGSVEYSFQIVDQFQFALFYDWGFVNVDTADFNPVNYNDNIGFGVRILVLGAPMRLDFGIPLTTGSSFADNEDRGDFDNDEGNQFWFTFGTRF